MTHLKQQRITMEQKLIPFPTKPSTLLNSIFMSTINSGTKALVSVATGGVEKWGIGDHLRYATMLMTWVTVWFLRVLMDHLPSSFLPSPHYFLSGGGLLSLGSSDSSSSSSSTPSTCTDLILYGDPNGSVGPSSRPLGRALSHILGLLSEMPATSRKYQFAIAMADNIVEENARDGHGVLQQINRAALSSAFSRTTNLLHQSLQTIHGNNTAVSWSSQLLSLVPYGSYITSSIKGFRYLTTLLPLLSAQHAANVESEITRKNLECAKAEKLAHELLWITNKLRSCMAVDEAVVQWSLASGLASSSLMANPRIQNTIVVVSAILVREIAKGECEVPKQVKFRLLLLWMPLFCYASNGLAYPVITGMEKNEMEKAIEEVIGTLPLSDQEIILTNWFQDFISSNSDWPNLQRSYDKWCRSSRKLLM